MNPAKHALGGWRVGVRMLGRFVGLFTFLYAAELLISLGAAAVMSEILAALFAHRPLFDVGVSGDLAALTLALGQHPWLPVSLSILGLAAALLYAVLSWFLAGGLISVLLKRPVGRSEVAERFGRGGGRFFFPFVRLGLWSFLPYTLAATILVLGIALLGGELEHALTPADVVWPALAGALPGALLFFLARTAIEYARVDLARHPGLPARRALLRAYRLLLRRPAPLLHALPYPIFFLVASAIYVAATAGRPMAGLAGALSLFALRQATLIVRAAARFALTAGQVELSQDLLFPPRPT